MGLRELVRAEERERQDAARVVLGLVVAFGGTLGVVVLAAYLGERGLSLPVQVATWNVALVVVGALGTLALGKGALRASLGRGLGGTWLPWGALGGLITLAVGWGWVALVARLADVDTASGDSAPAWLLWLAVAVAPPLVEEWLCRGVLWEAARRAGGERTALVATAALFALLHGPGGGALGLPNRLVMGVVFGWLRLRSASLAPGVVAHAMNNALALVLFGG